MSKRTRNGNLIAPPIDMRDVLELKVPIQLRQNVCLISNESSEKTTLIKSLLNTLMCSSQYPTNVAIFTHAYKKDEYREWTDNLYSILSFNEPIDDVMGVLLQRQMYAHQKNRAQDLILVLDDVMQLREIPTWLRYIFMNGRCLRITLIIATEPNQILLPFHIKTNVDTWFTRGSFTDAEKQHLWKQGWDQYKTYQKFSSILNHISSDPWNWMCHSTIETKSPYPAGPDKEATFWFNTQK